MPPLGRTPEQVKRELEQQREKLATAVEHLRDEIGEAADITGRLRAKLPAVAAGALGAGFFFAGGIGATMRYFARRSREGNERVRVGRFSIFDRD